MKEIMVVVVSSFLLTGCVTAHRHNSTCLSPGEYNVDFSGPMFNTSPMWTNMTVWVLPCPVVGLEYVTSSSNVYSTAVDPRSQKITAVIKPKQGLERRIYLRTDGTNVFLNIDADRSIGWVIGEDGKIRPNNPSATSQ